MVEVFFSSSLCTRVIVPYGKKLRRNKKNDIAPANMLFKKRGGVGGSFEGLVDANGLNVTGLFAFVADAFRGWLRRAIATQMTDLATYMPD